MSRIPPPRIPRIMRKMMISAVRVLHGVALGFGILLSAGFLVSVLREAQTKSLSRTIMYVLLYASALIVQLFIAWCAGWRFRTCSFRTAIILYVIWLFCFIWHGWFTEWAPFRLHEVLMPGAYAQAYKRIYLPVAMWVLCYSLFPILLYFGNSKRATMGD